MLVGCMKKSLAEMEQDIKKYEGVDKILLDVTQDAHFEKLRCDSGNLNEVLEDNRIALSIMFESTEIDQQISEMAIRAEKESPKSY